MQKLLGDDLEDFREGIDARSWASALDPSVTIDAVGARERGADQTVIAQLLGEAQEAIIGSIAVEMRMRDRQESLEDFGRAC